jgi:hypothetical protein
MPRPYLFGYICNDEQEEQEKAVRKGKAHPGMLAQAFVKLKLKHV